MSYKKDTSIEIEVSFLYVGYSVGIIKNLRESV